MSEDGSCSYRCRSDRNLKLPLNLLCNMSRSAMSRTKHATKAIVCRQVALLRLLNTNRVVCRASRAANLLQVHRIFTRGNVTKVCVDLEPRLE